MNNRLQVVGHRGLPALYPENTLISFEQAIAVGVDAIEFDVHTTRDGHLVVTHDDMVNRCSNGNGRVRDYTFKAIRQLDFGSWKGPQFAGIRIPTIDEVLDTVYSRRSDLFLLIEIKENDEFCAREVLSILQRWNIIGKCLVLSFHPEILTLLRRLEPQLCLQGFPDRYLQQPAPGGYGIINKTCIWTKELTAEEISFFHRQRIAVDVCPVDDSAALDKVLAYDIDSFTTNAAQIIMQLLRQKGYR